MRKGAWIGRILLGIIVAAGILVLLGIALLVILPALLIAVAALLVYHLVQRGRFSAKRGSKKPSPEILLRPD